MNKKTYHIFLVLSSFFLFIAGCYLYFSHGLDASAADSSLASSNAPTQTTVVSTGDEKITLDTAFISTLASLNKITIDTSIFQDKAFLSLSDNTVNLDAVTYGRPNPFAPFDTTSTTSTTATLTPQVITNDALNVTTKSANLNGSLGDSITPTGVYFEYGKTEALGSTTLGANISRINTFVINITGLSPKTTYYYKAVARVGTATVSGETVSFTTK